MAFTKSFARYIKGSSYPRWEDVSITKAEEKLEEEKARAENVGLMNECVKDAKGIMDRNGLKKFQSDMISVAIALFEKRASHTVFFKENRCRDRFEELFKK